MSGRTRSRRRANGEGSVYFVAREGRWRGATTFIDETGRARRRTVSASSQHEARRRLAQLLHHPVGTVTLSGTTSLARYLAGWLDLQRQRVRPSTWRQREQVVRCYLVPALGGRLLARLTPSDVEALMGGMIDRGLAPRTAAHARVILRRALADAERDGLVVRNVAALSRAPHVPYVELKCFTQSELRRLVKESSVHPLHALFVLAATIGLRQGELLALSWSDVDLARGTVTIRHSLARDGTGGKPSAGAAVGHCASRRVSGPGGLSICRRRRSKRCGASSPPQTAAPANRT